MWDFCLLLLVVLSSAINAMDVQQDLGKIAAIPPLETSQIWAHYHLGTMLLLGEVGEKDKEYFKAVTHFTKVLTLVDTLTDQQAAEAATHKVLGKIVCLGIPISWSVLHLSLSDFYQGGCKRNLAEDELFLDHFLRLVSNKEALDQFDIDIKLFEVSSLHEINLVRKMFQSRSEKKGWTPLHQAALEGNVKAIKIMLAHGADINSWKHVFFSVRDTAGHVTYPPIYYALTKGHANAIKFLLEQGANVWLEFLNVSISKDSQELVELLLTHYLPAQDIISEGKMMPVHMAALSGNKVIIDLLYSREAAIGMCNNEGLHALHLAVIMGHEDIVGALLVKGTDVNVKSDCGWWSAEWSRGALKEQVSKYAIPPRFKERRKKIIELLLSEVRIIHGIGVRERKCTASALHFAALLGYSEIAKLLLQNEVNIEAVDERLGMTPLHWAAAGGNKEIVELLIFRGACVQAKDLFGKMPHEVAALKGHKEVSALLEKCFLERLESVDSKKCLACQKTELLKRCGRCKKVYFCNDACQRSIWHKHKAECK